MPLENKATTGAKKTQTSQLQIGGHVFKKSSDEQGAKQEKSAELLLAVQGVQPKHCNHLLK